MKNKGFTMVELLATITILGILMMTAIIAYSRYKEHAPTKAYNAMSLSASSAADNYFMDNLLADSEVSLEDLVNDEYLESLQDPWDNKQNCSGKVTKIIENTQQGDNLESYIYEVELKCSKMDKCIRYNDSSTKKCQP